MLASGREILELIPQRPPMVMIDTLLECEGTTTITELLIRNENVFLTDSGFSPSGMLEAMAQTAAVRTGWLLKSQTGAESKHVPIGVIGSIKNFKLHFQPAAGSKITTTVRVEYEVLQATVVKARTESGGLLAAEADLQIFLPESDNPSK